MLMKTGTVIVGGGQAGLSLSAYLAASNQRASCSSAAASASAGALRAAGVSTIVWATVWRGRPSLSSLGLRADGLATPLRTLPQGSGAW